MNLEYVESLAELVRTTAVAEVTVRRGDQSVTVRRRPCTAAVITATEVTAELSAGAVSTDITPLPTRPAVGGLPVAVSAEGALVPLGADRPEPATQLVRARRVGVFHRGASEAGAPLVHAGDWVAAAQQLGSIESMRLFDEIDSPVSGRVIGIFVEDGAPVEYGQELFHIEVTDMPEAGPEPDEEEAGA